jgi:protein TonB
VSFVVDEHGDVVDAKVIRGIGGGCDEESLRVVNLMPRWKPGAQDGKPVNVLFNMPIYYKLRGPGTKKNSK